MSDHLTDVEQVILKNTGHLGRLLFALTGPSGVGKNTIIKKLLANHPGTFARVRTYTTRQRRDDEVDGDQYHFVTPEEFAELAREGRLMEADAATAGHDVYGLGKVYSMPLDVYEEIPPEVPVVIAEVDVHGARRLRERYPECISIFITAPPAALLHRIHERADESMNDRSLAQRMATAQEQMRAARHFEYVIFNREDHLDEAVTELEGIILAERRRVREGFNLEAYLPPDAFDVPLTDN
jgi:guanylate kinase